MFTNSIAPSHFTSASAFPLYPPLDPFLPSAKSLPPIITSSLILTFPRNFPEPFTSNVNAGSMLLVLIPTRFVDILTCSAGAAWPALTVKADCAAGTALLFTAKGPVMYPAFEKVGCV